MIAKVYIYRRNFSLLCSNLAIIGRIFCNREYFSGNEGEDLQPQNFFTTNKKQYTVYSYKDFIDHYKLSINMLSYHNKMQAGYNLH